VSSLKEKCKNKEVPLYSCIKNIEKEYTALNFSISKILLFTEERPKK